jgi:hypothetical protein
MRVNKFRVCILDESGNVSEERTYKSLSSISEELKLDYHVVRRVHRLCNGEATVKRTLQNEMRQVMKRLQIFEIPVDLTFLTNGENEMKLSLQKEVTTDAT